MATIDYKQKIKDYMNSSEVDTLYKSMLNNLFPELKESEDERIMKAIGYAIGQSTHSDGTLINGVSSEEALAWLEQGKQKPADKVELKFKEGDKVLVDGKVYTIKLVNEDNYIVDENGRDVQEHFSYTKDWKLYDQNITWSEEDEVALGDALWCCNQAASIVKDENDIGNVWYAERWIKSLKERVLLQPKQEWSEEDKRILTTLINYLEEHGGGIDGYECIFLADWLKSLRPQSQWKPSKEQIVALRWILNNFPYDSHKEEISGLLEQLKKLRGE